MKRAQHQTAGAKVAEIGIGQAASGWRQVGLGACVIVVLTFAAHWPTLQAGFIWDDDLWLWNNPLTLAGDGIWRFWVTTQTFDYFPLTSSVFWLEWRLWGKEPTGYLAVNMALHAISGVALWRVLRRLAVPGAWLAAMLFAVHPVTVPSVRWIAELKNTLSLLPFLLSISAFLRFQDSRKRGWFALSLALFALGLSAKVSVATLPAILLLTTWWRKGRIAMKDLLASAPFFALSAAFSAAAVWFQVYRILPEVRAGHGPADWAERLVLAGKVVWFYLYKALLPFRLSLIYPHWDTRIRGAWDVVPLLAAVVVTVVLFRYRRGWARPAAFALGCYVLGLLPVLGFVDMSFMKFSFVSDHLHYVALAGPIALVVGLGAHAAAKFGGRGRILGAAAAGVAVVGLSTLTMLRANVYKDELALWKDTVDKNPRSWRTHNIVGQALEDRGDLEGARRHYLEAKRLGPGEVQPIGDLGRILTVLGQWREAIPLLEEGLKLDPNHQPLHCGLGMALDRANQLTRAEQEYRRAIELAPDSATLQNLGGLLCFTGRREEGVRNLLAASAMSPKDGKILAGVGKILMTNEQYELAADHLARALRRGFETAAVHYQLAACLATMGKLEAAVPEYEAAIRLDPKHQGAQEELARVRSALASRATGQTGASPGVLKP